METILKCVCMLYVCMLYVCVASQQSREQCIYFMIIIDMVYIMFTFAYSGFRVRFDYSSVFSRYISTMELEECIVFPYQFSMYSIVCENVTIRNVIIGQSPLKWKVGARKMANK